MKKWLIITYTILLSVMIFIISFSLFSVKEENLYTIPQIKSFTDNDELIRFELYSNKPDSDVKYVENNIYKLILDSQEIILNNVNVEEVYEDGYYLYIITADNFNKNNITLNSRKCNLEIINSKGTYYLNLGSISILNTENIQLLGVDSFYASYSYINGSLFLVGLNIILSKSYDILKEVSIGGYARSINSLIQENKLYQNEMNISSSIPDYTAIMNFENEQLKLNSNTLFIPISYVGTIKMIKSGYIILILDDIIYYLDTFNFISNDINMNNYLSNLKEVKYVAA